MFRGGSVKCDMQSVMLRRFLLLVRLYFSSDLLTGWSLVIFNLVNEVREFCVRLEVCLAQ